MRHLILIGCAILITACGSDDKTRKDTNNATDSRNSTEAVGSQTQKKTSKSFVSISAVAMETEEQANGQINHCHIRFEIDNRSDQRIKRLTMTYKPQTSDEFDEMVHAAAGEQSLYFRDVPKGKSSEVERVMSLQCEGLTALNIFEEICATENGPCNPNIIKIDGGDLLMISRS